MTIHERRRTDPPRAYVEILGLIVGSSLVVMMLFTTVAPFFIGPPSTSVRLIDQQQTILQSVFMVLVGYLWRDLEGSRTKNETINTLAKTAAVAGAALAPIGDQPSIVIPEGGSATAKATEAGTVITPDQQK